MQAGRGAAEVTLLGDGHEVAQPAEIDSPRPTSGTLSNRHDPCRETVVDSAGPAAKVRPVKLMWFHLMPYPALPEDFNKKHRSVWVDIDPGLFDPDIMADCYERYIDQLVYAEECGFDGICVNEHHGNGYGLMPSPNLIGSILGTRTSRAAITVLGNSVALYNPPVRVAEEMAMLDLLSRGRLIAGFPVGTSMDTAYAYGVNPGDPAGEVPRGHRPRPEGVGGEGAVRLQRRFNQFRYVNVLPRPLQQPHPPIWIPGGGSVETWDYCSNNDFVYAALSYYGHLMAKETVGGYWRRVEENGKDPNPNRLAFIQFVGVADTDAEAYRLYREPAEYFFNRSLHVYPGFTDPPGLRHRGVGPRAATSRRCGPWPGPSRPSTTSRGTRWSRRATSSSAAPTRSARRSRTWPRPSTAATCSPCCSSAT